MKTKTGGLFGEPQPTAEFSDDGRYRWFLSWPTGVPNGGILTVIAANPSKAGQLRPDGTMKSDPTISRLRSLATEMGFSWLYMANVRSYVATDPNDVPGDPEAIGEGTDGAIRFAIKHGDLVLCAWGHLAGARGPVVMNMIREAGKVPHALALTKDGTPRHPRGIPKSARPEPLPE